MKSLKWKKIALSFKTLYFTSLILLGQDIVFAQSRLQRSPESIFHIKQIVDSISKSESTKELRDFVGCCRPNRIVGTPGHQDVSTYLISKIKEIDSGGENLLVVENFNPDIDYGIDFFKSNFDNVVKDKLNPKTQDYIKWKNYTDYMVNFLEKFRGFNGKNIVWEKKGSLDPKKMIIIAAHYDTLNLNKENLKIDTQAQALGANDNGTGVAIALLLIRLLSKIDIPKTIRIVFFDFQEMHSLGSHAYIKQHKQELEENYEFSGILNLNMLGYDTKILDKTKRTGNFKLYIRRDADPMQGKDLKLARGLIQTGQKIRPQIDFDLMPNAREGDHFAFWLADFAGVMASQNWEEDHNESLHHSADDFVETLNLRTFHNATLYLTGAIIAWAFDIVK